MTKLKITIDREDYCVGLTGTFNGDGFSGFGEAWFNNSKITQFSAEIVKLVDSMNGTAELIGSESKSDGSQYLETFSLRCYVLSASKLNGVIGVHITLSNPSSGTNSREPEIFKMSGELKVRNHRLKDFSVNLKELLNGHVNEVILNGDLNDI